MFLFSISLIKELVYLFIPTVYKSIYCFHLIIPIDTIALNMLNAYTEHYSFSEIDAKCEPYFM